MSHSDEEELGGNRYEYPNGVLRNVLGLTDVDELKRVEATYSAIRLAELLIHPIVGKFDLDHLKAIHRHIFQDVYDWAGELRQVDIIKESSQFAHFAYLEQNANRIFQQLAGEHWLRNQTTVANFSSRAAYYLGELNALPPFREGNGRAQRTFFTLLARDAGYILQWERISTERMVEASVKSFTHADTAEFGRIFLDIAEPI